MKSVGILTLIRLRRRLTWTAFLLLACSGGIMAQLPPLEQAETETPVDLDSLRFYLITVDVGNNVWDNFGHTALRLYDENTNTDLVFNWGVFDISGGVADFSYNFFKGVMDYRLATSSSTSEFDVYRAQGRTVWQDRLNLTNPQKEKLYRRLMWNLQAENLAYEYHYFFDNCTTRVRDYLDEALGGAISDQYSGVTEKTFRHYVREHYASASLIGFSLDVLLNSNVDQQVSEWEEMFLPLTLRQRLQAMSSDVGGAEEVLPLLSDHQKIMEFPPPTVQPSAYQIASVGLLVPLLALLLMLKRLPMTYLATHSRISLRAAGLSFRLLGLVGVVTALFSGIFGFLMLSSWFVSDHIDTHHNFNLLLFWPTDLLGVVIATRWLVFCRPWPMSNDSAPFIHNYLLAHVGALLAYSAAAFFQLTSQLIVDLAVHLVPGLLLFTLLIWLVGLEPARSKNIFS
ncbi:MAG: DUF4105 domain-containing protein [Pseudomonadota bacterium]|nr:DUF4105 domain-containing protein [Pseudomonadota bacterium]